MIAIKPWLWSFLYLHYEEDLNSSIATWWQKDERLGTTFMVMVHFSKLASFGGALRVPIGWLFNLWDANVPSVFFPCGGHIHLLSEKQRPHPPTRLFLFFVYSITLYLGLNKDGITLFSEKVEAVYIYCMWAGDSSWYVSISSLNLLLKHRKIKQINHILTLSCHFFIGEETSIQLVFTKWWWTHISSICCVFSITNTYSDIFEDGDNEVLVMTERCVCQEVMSFH